MTVDELINDKVFCLYQISKAVFGNGRIISDKIKNNRNKRWMEGDKQRIADHMNAIYGMSVVV